MMAGEIMILLEGGRWFGAISVGGYAEGTAELFHCHLFNFLRDSGHGVLGEPGNN